MEIAIKLTITSIFMAALSFLASFIADECNKLKTSDFFLFSTLFFIFLFVLSMLGLIWI